MSIGEEAGHPVLVSSVSRVGLRVHLAQHHGFDPLDLAFGVEMSELLRWHEEAHAVDYQLYRRNHSL